MNLNSVDQLKLLIQLNRNLIILYLGNEIQIDFICCSNDAKEPLKAYADSAVYDLFANESVRIMSNSRGLVCTGIKMSIPKGFYGQISRWSGLVLKNGVVAFSGTIDSGYLGIVYVLLCNFSSNDFLVEKGNRIAQMIFKKCENVSFSNVENLTFDSEGGVKGFGSSGL